MPAFIPNWPLKKFAVMVLAMEIEVDRA